VGGEAEVKGGVEVDMIQLITVEIVKSYIRVFVNPCTVDKL
jgi:hypothetical protein